MYLFYHPEIRKLPSSLMSVALSEERMCLPPPAVAQEFGLSQAASTVSSCQQPPPASSTIHILSLLLRLRQCCCHPSLLKKVVRLCAQETYTQPEVNTQSQPGTPADSALLLQALDSSELNGDGVVLSLEEQLSALSLTSSPSQSGPDSKDIVALNGAQFPSQLFEETSESTKVTTAKHPIFPTSGPFKALSNSSSLFQISAIVSELGMIREKNSDQKR